LEEVDIQMFELDCTWKVGLT